MKDEIKRLKDCLKLATPDALYLTAKKGLDLITEIESFEAENQKLCETLKKRNSQLAEVHILCREFSRYLDNATNLDVKQGMEIVELKEINRGLKVKVEELEKQKNILIEWLIEINVKLDPKIEETRRLGICSECQQIDMGQTGEYFCPKCGLPTVWDDGQKRLFDCHNIIKQLLKQKNALHKRVADRTMREIQHNAEIKQLQAVRVAAEAMNIELFKELMTKALKNGYFTKYLHDESINKIDNLQQALAEVK